MRSEHISHAYIALHNRDERSYIWIMLMTGPEQLAVKSV